MVAYKMGKTVAEKVMSIKSGRDLKAGEIGICDIDFVIASDTTAPIAIKAFIGMGGEKVKNHKKIALFIDHASPAPNQRIANLHMLMRKFAKEQEIIIHDVGEGVCHQIVLEEKYIKTGDLVLGADSHTCSYGAIGALASGIGSTDLAAVMLTGQSWLRVPSTIRVNLIGNFLRGVYAKDLILYLIGKLGSEGANYKSIEFCGESLEKMTLGSKITISNMVIEMGAKYGIICDSTTKIKSDDNAEFEKYINIDLSKLMPYIAKPHQVDNVSAIDEVIGIPIHQGFIGSCTNGRIEDLRIAAKIIEGRTIAKGTRLIVIPASKKVFVQAIKEGIVEILTEAGATFISPGCGACVGTHNGIPGDGENVISSTNRNFKGRMGNSNANVYLASPATVAASVLYGRITDPRMVMK